MKYTDKLGLPIWNKPETDVFDIEQFNEGMQAIDDIVIDILKKINDLVIGDTQIDLNGYVKEEALKEYAKRTELSKFLTQADLLNYLDKTYLDRLATKDELSSYAKTNDLSNYALTSSLSDYALKNSLLNYATTTQLQTTNNNITSLTDRVTTLENSGGGGGDISFSGNAEDVTYNNPNYSQLTSVDLALDKILDEYVTDTELSTELNKKVNKEVGKGLSTNDLTNELITKINSSATEAFVTNAIANAQLDGGDVDLSGYATVDALNLKANLTHTHDQYLTEVPDEYITETELTGKNYADKAYVTQAVKNVKVDLTGYAKTSDIPIKVSQLTNDKGYLSSIPSEYVTETELNAKGYLTKHQDISNLQPKTDNSLSTTNKTVVGAINELKTNISNINTGSGSGSSSSVASSEWSGKVANFLGDSQTEVNNHKTKIYHDWVKEILGLSKVNNYGISGSTIAKNPTIGNNAMCVRYVNMDNNADLICVMGGVNDRWLNSQLGKFGDTDPSTFYGAMETLCDGLLTKYCGKTIIFITPTEQNSTNCNTANKTGYTVADFSNAMKRVCAKYSIPVFDANTCSGIYPINQANGTLYTTDKLHLNNKGHEVLGKKLSKFILNGANVIMINNDNSGESGGGSGEPDTPEPDIPEPDIPSDNQFIGKTVTVTKNFSNGKFAHLVALLSVEEDMRSNSTYEITLRGSNVSNMTSATNTGGTLFMDNSGEVSNGLYVKEFCKMTTFTQTVSDGNLTITAGERTGLANTGNYVKVPILLSGTTPFSFRIDDIKVIVNGTERNILKLGSFFTSDKETITISTPDTPDTNVRVTGISLNKDTLTMNKIGGTQTLSYTITPSNATNKNVTWSTSVPTVASVNNGLVTANANGTTVITIRTTDGGHTDTCTVTVNDPSYVEDEGDDTLYVPDIASYGISKDGTNSEATTNGLNRLFTDLNTNKKTNVQLPTGTYAINPDISLTPKSNLTLDLNNSKLKIDTNGKNGSTMVYLKEVENLTLKNGTIEGDRYDHDYSTYNQNTTSHEFNVGLKIDQGSRNINIDNVKFTKITGYGLATFQGTQYCNVALDKTKMESGDYNDSGSKVADATKIRYPQAVNITEHATHGYLQVGTLLKYQNYVFNSTRMVTVRMFDASGSLLSKVTSKMYRPIAVPSNATTAYLTFHQSNPKDYLEGDIYTLDVFHMKPPRDCNITNCTFDDNRCLGIAVCGGWNIKIEGNTFKNTSKPTSDKTSPNYQHGKPGYAIDIEDGWESTQDLTIHDNVFTNNGYGDIVSLAGDNTVITNNQFTGRVAMYSRNTNYVVRNNTISNAIAMWETEKDYGFTVDHNTYTNTTIKAKCFKPYNVDYYTFTNETITDCEMQLDTSITLKNSTINLDGTTGSRFTGSYDNCTISDFDGNDANSDYNTGIKLNNCNVTKCNFFPSKDTIMTNNVFNTFRVRLDGGTLTFTGNDIQSNPKNTSMPIVQLNGGKSATIKNNTLGSGVTVSLYTNPANITVITDGSSGSGGSSGSDTPTTTDEYAQSCTSEYILDKMYPMGQAHEAIPSGLITDTWKYNSRWENQYRPIATAHSCGQSGCPGTGPFQALGCWSNVYRVEGTPFTQNTGVEMKDIKVYGWYNGKWELVQHLPVPNGNFYAESFGGDASKYFADSVKETSTSKTVILREKNKIDAMNWNTGQPQTENCMYHPFSDVKNFDTKYEYIYTCIDLRKVKWDENGIDDRDSTHYCSNCGGDWWLAEGLMFHDSWQHNKGVCQPKMIEITNNWRRFSMTTVPEGWTNGFPKIEVITEDDYTSLDLSSIQKGQSFTIYDGALDLNNQTVFADITLDDTVASQNILSIGQNIDKWTYNSTTRIHIYYPMSLTTPTKEAEVNLVRVGRAKGNVTITNNKLKMALNGNGIYVNGTKVDISITHSDFVLLLNQKTGQIGALEGNTRSKATYNEIGIYNRLLSEEELIALTR